MVTEKEYSVIVQNVCKEQCAFNHFERLKLEYSDRIASNRSLERCKNLTDLIKLLQKRDLVSKRDITILEEIASVLGLDDITGNIGGGDPHISNQDPQRPPDVYSRISHLIGRDIGYKWKDFARALNIREGDIDNLEVRHRDIASRIYVMLSEFQALHPIHYRSLLTRALHDARRKDLAYEIDHMMEL